MLIEAACCVMLQTHPRLINWLNPALVKAAAWICWVGYTLGIWDLRSPSELQTAGVEVSNKKNPLSLFLAAMEGMVTGKAIHISPFKRSISGKILTLRWHLGFYSVNSLRTHWKCSFPPFTGVGDAKGEEMCSVPGEPSSQNSGVVIMINMNITQWIRCLYGQDEPGAPAELPSLTQLQRPGP